MRPTIITTICLLLLLAHADVASAQPAGEPPDKRYFYQPQPYGSMAMFTPWNVVLNGSFDVYQLDSMDRRLLKQPYGIGLKNVWENTFVHPGATISQIGWGKWITTEVLPLNFTKEGGQWLPNYQLHLIGGGMTYRMLAEWYQYNKVESPEIWAAGTIALYHVLNEAVENMDYVGYNTDPIADLALFDWLGVVLFMNDDVCEFFSSTLHMTDWSNLPMITFPETRLGSNGLYYSMKWNIPGTEQEWSVWYLMGMSNLVGVSHTVNAEHSLTVGGGLRGKYLYEIDPRVRLLTLELVPTGGVYWDRNNSLLASLTVSGQEDQTVILNVYPGVFDIAGISPAVWATWGSGGTYGVGVAFQGTFGVGYRNQ